MRSPMLSGAIGSRAACEGGMGRGMTSVEYLLGDGPGGPLGPSFPLATDASRASRRRPPSWLEDDYVGDGANCHRQAAPKNKSGKRNAKAGFARLPSVVTWLLPSAKKHRFRPVKKAEGAADRAGSQPVSQCSVPLLEPGFARFPSVVTWLLPVVRKRQSRERLLNVAKVLQMCSAAAIAAAGCQQAERKTSHSTVKSSSRRIQVGEPVKALYADGFWYGAVIASIHLEDASPIEARKDRGQGEQGQGDDAEDRHMGGDESLRVDDAEDEQVDDAVGGSWRSTSAKAKDTSHSQLRCWVCQKSFKHGGAHKAHERAHVLQLEKRTQYVLQHLKSGKAGAHSCNPGVRIEIAWDDGDPSDNIKNVLEVRFPWEGGYSNDSKRESLPQRPSQGASLVKHEQARKRKDRVWPEAGDKVEVKKNLGKLGWQWCHGECIGVDRRKMTFRGKVTHDVRWRGDVIVHRDDEDTYSVDLGWRPRAIDPDNECAPVWPKANRYVTTMDNETCIEIAKNYGIMVQELVRHNKGRYPSLSARSILFEGSILDLPTGGGEIEGDSPGVGGPRGVEGGAVKPENIQNEGSWSSLATSIRARLQRAPCLTRESTGLRRKALFDLSETKQSVLEAITPAAGGTQTHNTTAYDSHLVRGMVLLANLLTDGLSQDAMRWKLGVVLPDELSPGPHDDDAQGVWHGAKRRREGAEHDSDETQDALHDGATAGVTGDVGQARRRGRGGDEDEMEDVSDDCNGQTSLLGALLRAATIEEHGTSKACIYRRFYDLLDKTNSGKRKLEAPRRGWGEVDFEGMERQGLSLKMLAEGLLSWEGLAEEQTPDDAAAEFCRIHNGLKLLPRKDVIAICQVLSVHVETGIHHTKERFEKEELAREHVAYNSSLRIYTRKVRMKEAGNPARIGNSIYFESLLDQLSVALTSPCDDCMIVRTDPSGERKARQAAEVDGQAAQGSPGRTRKSTTTASYKSGEDTMFRANSNKKFRGVQFKLTDVKRIVDDYGGFDECTAGNRWPEVAREIGFDTSNVTDAAVQLKTIWREVFGGENPWQRSGRMVDGGGGGGGGGGCAHRGARTRPASRWTGRVAARLGQRASSDVGRLKSKRARQERKKRELVRRRNKKRMQPLKETKEVEEEAGTDSDDDDGRFGPVSSWYDAIKGGIKKKRADGRKAAKHLLSEKLSEHKKLKPAQVVLVNGCREIECVGSRCVEAVDATAGADEDAFVPRLKFYKGTGTLSTMMPLYGQDREEVPAGLRARDCLLDDRAIDLYALLKFSTSAAEGQHSQKLFWDRRRKEKEEKKKSDSHWKQVDVADANSLAQHLVFLANGAGADAGLSSRVHQALRKLGEGLAQLHATNAATKRKTLSEQDRPIQVQMSHDILVQHTAKKMRTAKAKGTKLSAGQGGCGRGKTARRVEADAGLLDGYVSAIYNQGESPSGRSGLDSTDPEGAAEMDRDWHQAHAALSVLCAEAAGMPAMDAPRAGT